VPAGEASSTDNKAAGDKAAAEKKQQDQLRAKKLAEQQARKQADEARRAAEARQAQEAAARAAEQEHAAQAREQEAARARAEAAARAAAQQTPSWQSALRSELEVCGRQNFVQKVVCTEQAIWKHCPGHWGQIPECRENRRSP